MAEDTPGTPRAKTYPLATQKVADAWAMRVRGADWATIARTVGYSNPQNAMRAVRRFAGRLPEPTAADLRSLWRERLEYLWPMAARDVENGRPGATRAAVAIAQRAAQLDGLDAPQQLQLTADDAVVERLVSEMMRRTGHEEIEDADVIDLDVLEIEAGDEA